MRPRAQKEFRYQIGDLGEHLLKVSPLAKLVGMGVMGKYMQAVYAARQRVVTKWVKSGRLLDVGCEAGTFLRQFGSGWRVVGVEVNKQIAKYPGLNIWVGDIAKYRTKEKFNVVTMWHTLEHLRDPKKTLAKMAKLLNPGGFLVIEVPNAGSVWRKIFGKYWRLWMYPQHVWFWDKKSLSKLLEMSGFEVVEAGSVGLMNTGPGSLIDLTGKVWLGLLFAPLSLAINLLGRDNLRVVAKRG